MTTTTRPKTCPPAAQAASCPARGCKTCERTGLPILPLRYAAIPLNSSRKVPLRAGLGAGITDKKLTQHAYSVRTLRRGYLYVYLEGKKTWQAYGVTPEGHFTQFPIPWDPPGDINKPLDAHCVREGHNIPAAFINIPYPNTVKKIWLAFSQMRWRKEVFQRYASDAALRNTRMIPLQIDGTSVEGQAHAFDLDEQADALQSQVEEYATAMEGARERDGWSTHDYASRSKLVPAMQVYSATFKKNTKRLPAAVVLPDPAGMVAELNFQRAREQLLHQSWAQGEGRRGTADPERAWKKLSSDAITGVRESMRTQALSESISELWGDTPAKQAKAAGLPATAKPEQVRDVLGNKPITITPPPVTMPNDSLYYPPPYTTTAQREADKRAKAKVAPMEQHYSEAKRKAFADQYEATAKKHLKTYATLDKDYSIWLNAKAAAGAPTLDTLCSSDYLDAKPTVHCIVGYARLVSESVAGGPGEHSRAWFESRVKLGVEEQAAILQRALVGNDKALFKWLNEEKNDSVYDEIKSLTEGTGELAKAGHLPGHKFITPVVAAYSSPVLAAIGATAMLMRTDHTLLAPLQEAVERLVLMSMALWGKTQVALIKVRVKLGELQAGLMEAAFEKMLQTQMSSSKARKTMARANLRYRLPPHLADKVVEINLAIADAEVTVAGKAAASTVSVNAAAGRSNLHKGWRALLRNVPQAERVFVQKTLLNFHRTITMKEGLLGAGGAIIQTMQLLGNIEAFGEGVGEGQTDAMLGIGNAGFGLLAASTEVMAAARQKAMGKAFFDTWVRRAAGLGAVSTGFMAVQSAVSSIRAGDEGDKDAENLHALAGLAFAGSAAASVAIFFGAKASFFGALLGLGPVGWGFILLGAGLILTWMAFAAEDGEAEKWVARNKWWTISGRTAPRFRNWKEEAEALNVLAYGLSVEFGWADTMLGRDELRLKVHFPQWIDGSAYRYRFVGHYKDPTSRRMASITHYNETSGYELAPLVRANPQMRAANFDAPRHPSEGKFELYDARAIYTGEGMTLTHKLGVDADFWVSGELEFEYWPDPTDESTKARVVLVATDDD